jgi:hypothetical protein
MYPKQMYFTACLLLLAASVINARVAALETGDDTGESKTLKTIRSGLRRLEHRTE